MTSSHSPASPFSPSLPPPTRAGTLLYFFIFPPAALLHERGRQILWQLQCFHLTPDGAASVYFTDQLLAKTTSSGSTQSAASPLGSLARSPRFMSSETHFFFSLFSYFFFAVCVQPNFSEQFPFYFFGGKVLLYEVALFIR